MSQSFKTKFITFLCKWLKIIEYFGKNLQHDVHIVICSLKPMLTNLLNMLQILPRSLHVTVFTKLLVRKFNVKILCTYRKVLEKLLGDKITEHEIITIVRRFSFREEEDSNSRESIR